MVPSARRLIIWGAGGHAKVVADLARSAGFVVAGYLDESIPRHHQPFYGAQILGGSSWLTSPEGDRKCELFVAIGDNSARARCLEVALRDGFAVPTLIHPAAIVSSSARLASGVIVMAGAIVQADASIGVGGIINTGASVDHDCVLGHCVHIAPGARLAGQVEIGDRTFVGIGAVVIPRMRIGHDCIVGAGAAVIRDVLDGQTVVGVPARMIPRNSP